MLRKEADNESLIKFLFDSVNEEEERQLLDWLNEDKSRYGLLERLLLAGNIPDEIKEAIPVESSLTYVISKVSKRKRYRLILHVAAVFIGFIVVVSGIYLLNKEDKAEWKTVSSVKGEKKDIVLADGTNILLAPDSRLSYPEAFDSDIREVKLEGEAYFEVRHEAKRHFVVHTTNADVIVLGTIFNINAYNDDSKMSTVLVNGKVKMRFRRSNEKESSSCILFPSQKVVYDMNKGSFSVHKVNLRHELAWMNNCLYFNNESLMTTIKKIERFYNVDIELSGKLPAKRVTGEFDGETLKNVLNTLQEWTTFSYQIKNNKVLIKF